MFEFSPFRGILLVLVDLAIFYSVLSLIARKILRPNWKELIYTIFLFSLFGVIGEAFVNTMWEVVLGTPLWEYRLYPAHGGDITYWFPFVWGSLGFYTYFHNMVFRNSLEKNLFAFALILGLEAIVLEIIVNVPFHFLFGEYIFYYFPANLGPFSHYSCLQVIPFYMIIGHITSKLIQQQEAMQYKHLGSTLRFYFLIMFTFVYLDLFI